MATIKISDLRPAGSELFQDSESFLNELTDREMGNLSGGAKPVSISINTKVSIDSQVSISTTGK